MFIQTGAVSGAAAFGVGELGSVLFTDVCDATATLTATQVKMIAYSAEAVFHGISQGVITGISGGNFWQGAATGLTVALGIPVILILRFRKKHHVFYRCENSQKIIIMLVAVAFNFKSKINWLFKA